MFHKSKLIVIFIFLALGGISSIYYITTNSKGANSQYKEQIDIPTTSTIDLAFSPLAKHELVQSTPKQTKEVSVSNLGKLNDSPITIHFYSDDPEPLVQGHTYGYLEYQNNFYAIGNVTSSYSFQSVKIKNLNKKMNKSDILVIGSVGTPFTDTKLIGYELDRNKFVMWDVMGELRFTNIGNDSETLVAIFEGVHLNPANVYILSPGQGTLEQADIGNTFQGAPVTIVGNRNSSKIEVNQKDGHVSYYYKQRKLVPATA